MKLFKTVFFITVLQLTGLSSLACEEGKGHKKMELTVEQQSCLEEIVGKRGQRESRPSHEEIKTAFESCGIQAPARKERRRS